ncbi:MAG: NADPH:quinone reductase [Haloarculaceae archaeon]
MRAVRYHEHGGPEVLTVEEIPRPEPADDELLVRIEAASVNPVDTYFRSGEYAPGDLPWIPASDCAGVVEATGADVEGFAAGDRVVATGLGANRQGTCAEYAAVPAELAAPLPDAVAFDDAAAVALVGVTAWRAFVDHADLDPAEHAVVHGANGGVGHVAVQLAAAVGADVTATARPAYDEELRALGADRVVDYRRDDGELAAALAEPGAPDVVLETVANETVGVDAEAAATGARLIAIGNTAPTAAVPMGPGKSKDLRVQVMSMFNTPDMTDTLSRLARLMDRGELSPVIADRYGLEGVAEAHERVLGESFLGKLVVEP